MTSFRARAALGSSAALAVASLGLGQILDENFDTVSETGGVNVFSGSGFNAVGSWDDGIAGEGAFAGTLGNAIIGSAPVAGDADAGVGGSGAGVISVVDAVFDLLNQSFGTVTGTGGGIFLAPDPNNPGQPDTFNFVLNWDDGIAGERAFGGTFGGAVLNGFMAAEGAVGGGNPGGAGRLEVSDVALNAGNWFAGLEWRIGAFPGAAAVANPGFEAGNVAFGAPGWSTFGNVFTEDDLPRTGTRHLKFFGTFPGNSGAFQTLPAQPGQTWELDAYMMTIAGDAIAGTGNSAEIRIEYFDAGMGLIASTAATVIDGSSPTTTYLNGNISLAAPANAAFVRPVVIFIQNATEGGSVFTDDVTFRLTAGPSSVDLSQFSLVADVAGAADGGAGETLGGVQLRLEDPQGGRLIFPAIAGGTFQGLGGPLDTAIEADPNGNPAPGAFNSNAAEFAVVVAFDNESGMPWGTGGELLVDNVRVTNLDSSGSGWFAGLTWEGLTAVMPDPNQLALTADVAGSVLGGAVELRVEAYRVTQAGLDDDFEGATQTGGGIFLDPNGGTFNFTTNWDDGLTGEGAFGGIANGAILPGGGIRALANIDPNGGGGLVGEVAVEGVTFGVGGGWFAGLQWSDQGLASDDLSQVELSARIRGRALGGTVGDYEFRIEDADGDRLFFTGSAAGGWQNIGGTLDTATEGAALDGGGDGTFNLDDPTYTVVLAFANEAASWGTGGSLQIDDLFLSPVTIRTEIGRVTFEDTVDAAFKTIGGALQSGVSNFGNFVQSFNSVTGNGGGIFFAPTDPNAVVSGGQPDETLPNSFGFAGTFGGSLGTVSADTCPTCGTAGDEAVVLEWTGATTNYFLGIAFTGIRVNLDPENLDNVQFLANIKGETNGGGSSLGRYVWRIEDAQTDFIEFPVNATGAFQSAGGALSSGTLGSTPDGDGAFDFNQETYSAVLVVVEPPTTPTWGSGGRLIIDDIFITGIQFDDADEYTVVVGFDDAVNTWGVGGTLTVDNISLAAATIDCPGDADGSNDVTLDDLLIVLGNFGNSGPNVPGDVDGSGEVGLDDLLIVLGNFGAVCP